MLCDEDRRKLREAVSENVPEAPGVYVWLGADREPLYVGKAVRLRRRMLSYLAPSQTDNRSRRRHLAFSIRAFEYRETAGELAALLLEDALIKQLRPRHNVRQRDYLERRYLLLTNDPFPTCIVVERDLARPGKLYGPFKDQYFVADLIALITDEFGLRACQDRQPFRKSARFDLGVCRAPCRDAVSIAEYSEITCRVRAFLDGEERWIVGRLTAAMECAAEALRFERAAEAKERLALCRRFTGRQRFIRAFRESAIPATEPRFGLAYRFERGALVKLTHQAGILLPIPEELAHSPEDARFALDRANLVHSWLAHRG
jgi:excinuclease ABC subunit C